MATNFDPSIYNIHQMVNNIAKQYVPDQSEDTLALGMFGYIGDIAALQIQNDIILNSELGNELWPSRAKYEKNVIAHSITQNIVDINAVPATMQILLQLEESKLDPLFVDDIFTIDKEYSFFIGDFEYHLEYDLKLQRSLIADQGYYIYSARYDMNRKNELSEIVNPYTATPYVQNDQGKPTVYIQCQLMQVTHTTEYKKIISSSAIDNKTFEFTFEDQLAGFEVAVTENGVTTYLTPIFDGAGIDNNIGKYCYYNYIDSKTIRIRFDSLSYLPSLNANVEVYIRTTKGADANFDYDGSISTLLSSERFGYKNFAIAITPLKDSKGGKNRKTVDELRQLLPKEALSRGSITNTQDLQNYFNTMILDSNKLKIEIMKKMSNDFEKRSYYAYLLLKDEYDNVVPTNTINLEIPKSLFDTHDNRKYVLKSGSYIVDQYGIGQVLPKDSEALQTLLKDDTNNLIYTIPFMMVVTADPLYVSYYLPLMNYPVYLSFDYINQNSAMQFISTYITWTRKFLTDNNYYFLDMELKRSINDGQELIAYNEEGEIIDSRLKVVMVMYNDDTSEAYRYAFGEVVDKDDQTNKYHVRFKYETTDQINDDNKIRIENVYVPVSNVMDYGYFTSHMTVKLYVLYKSLNEETYGLYGLDSIVPVSELQGWSVTNVYSVNGGLNFYYNYSEIISSTITDATVDNNGEPEQGFIIKSIPVVKHSYMNDEHNIQALLEQINYEKAYIDNAVKVLENNFGIDFKFFNTYGRSNIYSLDKLGHQIVDRVHLTLNFEIKLLETSDNNTKTYIIQDIKQIIENLNDLESLHIPNLITTITNNYRNSIAYIEFLGFNDYGPGEQHLYRQDIVDITTVPEFLTINVKDNGPDINITLA